jgi:uncharacterized protein involved in exopolysaccharide biosynthesis
MENQNLIPYENHPAVLAPNPRAADFIAIGNRWRGRMAVVFLLVMMAAAAAALFVRSYESEMKIVVKRDAVDPLMSPTPTYAGPPQEFSEEELSAEAELMRNDDVLRKVVLATGLQNRTQAPLWLRLTDKQAARSEDVIMAAAVKKLKKDLEIVRPRKSNVITVSYASADPHLPAVVLAKLAEFYTEKHIEVLRPPGRYEFLSEQADKYRAELAVAESRLADFPRTGGAVAGQMELDITVRTIGDLRASLQQTQAASNEIQKRIQTLEGQLASTPSRMMTSLKTSDNPHLLAQLKATLLSLELKRTNLLEKFQPTYRDVVEVEQEIAQTRASIATAESKPLRDETTDRDPTYEWIRGELTKARAEANALDAKAATIRRSIVESEGKARTLNDSSIKQQSLIRAAKSMEENYQLYTRKREDARIADALERNKILNFSIAQKPSDPVLPKTSPTMYLLGGLLVAVAMSAMTGLASEHMDSRFRTSDQVAYYLNVPVLAVLPASEKEMSRHGEWKEDL